MTLTQFTGLTVAYLCGLFFVLILTYREFLRERFNFNIFFSLLYLLTFYFGYPFSCLLVFRFNVEIVPVEFLFYALFCATSFYAIYYISYKTCLKRHNAYSTPAIFNVNRVEANFICFFLALIALVSVAIFFINNGFLLFKLTSYNQIFSNQVSGVALKRFFYFFIPAMLMVYFVRQTKPAWLFFLFITVTFGLLTYLIVGGTRANVIIAFALFLFIGITRDWIKLWMLLVAGSIAVIAMFWLALKRYGLAVNGDEAFYSFLFLTRDTFSPWENLALILKNYHQITYQGLMPILRDFYVYIPNWLWPDRPSSVFNTANYFTWEVLNYANGLAISPTLLGSLLLMGGVLFIPLGALVVGLIIKWFDWLYISSKIASNRYSGALLKAFCFGAVFNIIVLVREGLDAFVSRIVFFCIIFIICLLLAKLVYLFFAAAKLIKRRQIAPHLQPVKICKGNNNHGS